MLYVKLLMFILMSNMIFLCPGWIYEMYAISNMIFLCPGWIYKTIALCDIALVYSYVQHDFLCWGRICSNLFYLIFNMLFLCQGWIYEMVAVCKIAHIFSYVQHEIPLSRMNLRNVCHMQQNIFMSKMFFISNIALVHSNV